MGTQKGQVSPTWVVVKNWKGYLSTRSLPWGSRGSSLTPSLSALGYKTGNGNTPNLWLWKQEEIVAEWDRMLLEWQAFLLQGWCTYLLSLTSFKLQCWSTWLKNARNIWGKTELSSTKAGKETFNQIKVLAEAIVPLLSPTSMRVLMQVPYQSPHQPGKHCSFHPSDSFISHPIGQFTAQQSHFQ